ncbi:MAG: hypothetical protein AAF613_02010 [Pseudomonadota bacterium]
MSLAYPIAPDVDAALKGDGAAARTRYEAETAAADLVVGALVTEWHKPEGDIEMLISRAEAGEAGGFIQVYEDRDGRPVLAVTYWKTSTQKMKPRPEAPAQAGGDDHTDDLYFKHGRTKKRRRARGKPDPNQMDLFGAPETKPSET